MEELVCTYGARGEPGTCKQVQHVKDWTAQAVDAEFNGKPVKYINLGFYDKATYCEVQDDGTWKCVDGNDLSDSRTATVAEHDGKYTVDVTSPFQMRVTLNPKTNQ